MGSVFSFFHVILSICILTCIYTLDVKPQKEHYTPDYKNFHNLSAIDKELVRIARRYPSFIRHRTDFTSKQGRAQHVLHITNFTKRDDSFKDKDSIRVLLSYGEHAREFLPIETLFYFLYKLDERSAGSGRGQNDDFDVWEIILNRFDLYIIVIGNPDGRAYVERTKNYCWRGTSTGVDLNRNFDWEFGGKGSSADASDEEYRGEHAFSEPETDVYRKLTEDIAFDAFVSLHSGIRQIYIPYADTRSKAIHREPNKLSEMMQLARSLSSSTTHSYQYGKAAQLNEYTADGTVFDYMAGVRHIPFSYAIELWGPDTHNGKTCFDLFNPKNENLQKVVEEIYPLYIMLFKSLSEWKGRQLSVDRPKHGQALHSYTKHEVLSLTPGYVMLGCVILLTLLVAVHGKYRICRYIYPRRRVVSLRALSSTFSTNFFHT